MSDASARRHPALLPVSSLTRSPYLSSSPESVDLIRHTGGQSSDPEPDRTGEISDQEWEIRTGRAIYILQQTLPDFFSTGLVTSLETPVLAPGRDAQQRDDAVESIYSPRIRLTYTPLVPLPTPFPRTLHIEGLSMYMASSAFVRHTLNALYTDLHVVLRRVRVHGPPAAGAGPSPGLAGVDPPRGKHRSMREKSLFVGLAVEGVARVSGVRGGWEVNSTYTFSPLTGLVQQHTVDSIQPAPHQAVLDALRAALGKLGLGGEGTGASGVCRSGRG
ncbi:hypothetical protein B0H21DRAFT_88273 [Amylocystis lapponica]|nr:hypothetical protein B0H21DRAFT_88273 [Amylocystis lapponica]